jgi:hypothetical protein
MTVRDERTVGGASNLTKVDLLAYLADGPATALDAAIAFHITQAAASTALLRLVRQDLARRAVDPRKGLYVYEVSPKGVARLQYWEALEADDATGEGDVDADG